MVYSLLAVRNGINYPVEDDFDKLKEWLKRKTNIDLRVSYLDTDFTNLTYTVFKTDGNYEWYGLENGKAQLLTDSRVFGGGYNGVIFLYDQKFEYTDRKMLGAWAFFNDLKGMEYIEIPMRIDWEPNDNLYRILTHEILHAFHYDLMRKGVNTNDTMDLYDKEYDVEAPDGNRARNLKELSPYFARVCEQPEGVTLLQLLIKAYQAVITILTKKPVVERFAEAIKEHEGWFVPGENPKYPQGSVSYRHNNPGNLRWSPFENGNDGFSIFSDYEIGWRALIHQITIALDGTSSVYKPTDTLFGFFEKYAPSTDDNDPAAYAIFVAHKLNTTPNTQIKDIV